LSLTAKDNSPANDASMVKAAIGGDRRAWSDLYARYAPTVHGCILAKVPASDAEDLVQDVFVYALTKLSSLEDHNRFGGWLMTIARNRRADYWRRHKKTEQLDEAIEGKQSATRRTEAERALQAIRDLPDAYQEPLLLRLVEGMSGPEIAERLDMTHGSVRVNMTRGMKLLREALGESGTRNSEGSTKESS
jgi:RNA polymerase sigma-70 factor (ECF subfamily)